MPGRQPARPLERLCTVSGSEVFLAAGKAWPRGTLVPCERTLYVRMCTHTLTHTLPQARTPQTWSRAACALLRHLRKEMAGLGGPGSGCPWALQALLASSPAGSLSSRSPPSCRGSLLSLFKDPPVLEETLGSASIGSFVSVVRAPSCPRWRRQPSERGPPLPTRLQPHHPVQDPGQLPSPGPPGARKANDVVFLEVSSF